MFRALPWPAPPCNSTLPLTPSTAGFVCENVGTKDSDDGGVLISSASAAVLMQVAANVSMIERNIVAAHMM